MQDPNADTEWNDILRRKGILPPKEKPKEEEEEVPQDEGEKYENMTLVELDEFDDEEDERVMEMYRQKRIAEIKALQSKNKFGDVREISAIDYVQEVNKAGDEIWVVLHLFKQGVPLCTLLNQYLRQLAAKFPQVKFLNSVSTTCIPNYPEKNLPTIFVYKNGELEHSWIGPHQFSGMNLKVNELEWKLHKAGIVESTLEENPRPEVHDMMMSSIKVSNTQSKYDDISDEDD